MTQRNLEKILYADDDSDIREIATTALELLGEFSVETCDSGRDVVEKALQFHPDLFLLDVMMPGVDGPTALSNLREVEAFKHTPVVFMTAKVMDEEIERYTSMGVVAVIKKPFNPETLSEEILAIWEGLHE